MQRVVRSTLVGLLTIAGLTACGDKVTVPPQITNPADGTIHSVLVSPPSLTLAVGGKAILAASVDAGPAATDRTVTWASSDATVATVGTDGTVTGVKAGTVTITATSNQDKVTKGASAVTVGGGNTTAPTISIASVNQTNAAGQSVPANLAGAAGQLDVIVNVDAGGQILKSVSVTVKVGNDSLVQTQTLSSATAASFAAEAAASTITFSFNTAQFNATTGIPALHNGAATITASATTNSSTPQTANTTVTFTLANADGVVISNSFAPYTNAEGVTTVTTATDGGGLPWRGGSVTVTGIPVLYSGRTVSSVSLTLPGAVTPTQTLTAAPFSAVWSGSASSGPRVTGLTLVDPVNFEVNGTTPKGITPTVIALDNVGNDLGLIVLNAGITGATFRLDNTAPQPPLTFTIPARQTGWVNASYKFTGAGGAGGSTNAVASSTNSILCGDGPAPAAGSSAVVAGNPACNFVGNGTVTGGQVGVSAVPTIVATAAATPPLAFGTTAAAGVNSNALTTITYYSIAAGSYSSIGASGTSTSATTCSTAGWTKIATAGDLAATANNVAYVVRMFETDKLGNARCTDLSNAAYNINATAAFVNGKFGVDKVAPTAQYAETATDATAASNNGIFNAASAGPITSNFLVKIAMSDDASGTGATPITAMVYRLYIDPQTLAPSNFNTSNGCPSGISSGACTTVSAPSTTPGWFGKVTSGVLDITTVPGSNAGADASGCVGCGYFVFTQTPLDLARNAATSIVGSVATTLAGPCGGVGCRQVLIDTQNPVMGGIAVPATIVGGTTVAFATSATDNLDLGTYDYTLLYNQPISGGGATLPIRSPATTSNGQTIGTAFDNVLTTSSSFSLQVPTFIRNVESTTGADAPQNNPILPSQITGRVYDAANNPGTAVVQPISAVNVPQASRIDFAAPQPNTAQLLTFKVTNAATNISNGPATVTAANPTTVTLTASATGTESTTFQYLNPFTTVQFYYLDPVTTEYILIGVSGASSVTDNPAVTQRTFSWTVSWDPPAALPVGAVSVIAIGVNTAGDALVTKVNNLITLTNP